MTTRPHIRVPAPDEWATAQARFEAGGGFGLPLSSRASEHVTVAAAWLDNWTSLPLTWRQDRSGPEVAVLLTSTTNEAAPSDHHQRENVDTDVPARRRPSSYALPQSRKSSDAD